MSQVYPLIDGWIGYGDGSSMLVETGTPIDSDHPLVQERPELFTAPPAKPAPAQQPQQATPKRGAKASDG